MNWEDNIKPRLINSKNQIKMDLKYSKPNTFLNRCAIYFNDNQPFCMLVIFIFILCIFRLHYVYTNKRKKLNELYRTKKI